MRIGIQAPAAAGVRRGHPWIYREALVLTKGRAPKTGDVVEIADERGEVLGAGLYDADSPIAVRVYALSSPRRERVVLDDAAIARAVAEAGDRRERWFDPALTTAMRLCHGEGDRVPGMVIDRYADVAVLRTDGEAIARRIDGVVRHLVPWLRARGMRTLLARRVAARGEPGEAKVDVLWGDPPPDAVDVLENGMIMEVDVVRGQKTGAFLDQRDNRARVRAWAARRGGRVLNLFSYTGGFSLAAALGGAREVVSVDVAGKAHATAQRSFRKNGIDPGAHRFVTADALVHVDELARRGERFDIIVSDPPSFAKNERSVGRALAAYVKLHRSSARLLAEGGVLCAASCSSHVSMERFLGTLDDVALERSDLRVTGAWGPPEDHPSPAAFPEGRYLKFVTLT